MFKVLSRFLFRNDPTEDIKPPQAMITLINQSFSKDHTISKYALVLDISHSRNNEECIARLLGAQLVRYANTKVRCLPAYKHVINSEVHWMARNMSPQDHLFFHVLSDEETLTDSLGVRIDYPELQNWVSRFSYPLNLWLLLDFPNSARFFPPDFNHVYYCDAEMRVKKRSQSVSSQAHRAFCCIIAV